MVKTKWEWSPESETKRLIYAARQIANNFYQEHNFFVLPKLNGSPANHSIVVFPKFNYLSVKGFWRRVKTIEIEKLPLEVQPDLLTQTQALVQPVKPDFTAAQKLWTKAQPEILTAIDYLIPSPAGLIKSVTVWPTAYGTTCSFNRPRLFPADIYIYLRTDCGLAQITEAILTVLTRKPLEEKLGAKWEESELLADWLVQESFLKKILEKYGGNYTPTLKLTRNQQNAKLLKQSEEYLSTLGIKPKNGILATMPVNLSGRETEILNALKRRQGEIVSFDEISRITFPEEDKFSLYAVSKIIERLRGKLEQAGIDGSIIQTLRGEGYRLK